MGSWLVNSLVLSIVLTVVLNVAVRLRPGNGREQPARPEQHPERPGQRLRVVVPWKAMLIASIAGTVLLNVLLNVVVRLR